MLGAGIHMFPKELLSLYRDAVVDKKHGPKLKKAVKDVAGRGYHIGSKHYKKIPPGYDSSHNNAEYLLYNGLSSMMETKIPEQFHTKAIVDFAFLHYKKMNPIHEWLKEAIG